ncbi:hypothetical protein [Treponema sp.]|uniref:hypothetical protein n=1 Tax=Treponema sp. TaxID=166 RepID=UPI00298E239F|nr:hypothetical protein [Treponema sp.]MCR5614444.1 hypothetical protein [Treponema sp.]
MAFKYFLANLPFEFSVDICAFVNKKFKFRPSSKPYLSGDTYRKIADYLYDETRLDAAERINSFSKSKIDIERKIPLVFVSSWKLEKFNEEVLLKINRPFVLLTHQGDVNIKSELHKEILKNKYLVHWFAQNCELTSKKITPLPIGLEDRWRHNAGALKDFKKGKYKNNVKQPKIIFGFSINTNPESRAPCYMALCKNKNAQQIYRPLTCHLYRRKLSKYMFVASPAGNGLDCHRTWEAIYLGVVPIVESNSMNRYFKSLGLPMVLIDKTKWNELAKWTPEIMTKKFESEWEKADTKAMWLDYWVERINEYLK